jgi:hypothetical protein
MQVDRRMACFNDGIVARSPRKNITPWQGMSAGRELLLLLNQVSQKDHVNMDIFYPHHRENRGDSDYLYR